MKIGKYLSRSATALFIFSAFAISAHEGANHLTKDTDPDDGKPEVAAISPETDEFKQAETLFRTVGGYGCIACHGLYAQGGGNVGGNIRNHSLSQINNALKTEPTMKLLNDALNDQQKQMLAGYLKALGKFELIDWTLEGEASYVQVNVSKNTPNQVVILNKTFEPIDISLAPIGASQSFLIDPYATESYMWNAQPGEYRLQYNQHVLDVSVRF